MPSASLWKYQRAQVWLTVRLNWNGREGEGYEWRLGGQRKRGDLGLRLREREGEKKERERETRYIEQKGKSIYSQWPAQPQDVAPVHLNLLPTKTLSKPWRKSWPFSKRQLVEYRIWYNGFRRHIMKLHCLGELIHWDYTQSLKRVVWNFCLPLLTVSVTYCHTELLRLLLPSALTNQSLHLFFFYLFIYFFLLFVSVFFGCGLTERNHLCRIPTIQFQPNNGPTWQMGATIVHFIIWSQLMQHLGHRTASWQKD